MRVLPRSLTVAALLLIASWSASAQAGMRFVATAYALKGPTTTGHAPRTGTVAADTDVLPLGTKIRITEAGAYSGVYTVTDSGRKVQGRTIDIFLPTAASARRFGRRAVRVKVLKWGERE